MSDRELIMDRFVVKYYDMSDVGNDVGRAIPFGVRYKGEVMNEDYQNIGESSYQTVGGLIDYVTGLYSDFDTDEGVTVSEMIREWFEKKYEIMHNDIHGYLKDRVTIGLGTRNWETKVDGKTWFWKELIDVFDDDYSSLSIKVIYDGWYREEVEKASEIEMGNLFFP